MLEPKSHWPKLKLAEVEQMVFALFLLFLILFFSFRLLSFFYFFFFFFFLLISLFILFLFCFCFCPQKPEPCTLNPPLNLPSAGPLSAGPPLRWTPLDPPLNPPLRWTPLDPPPPLDPPLRWTTFRWTTLRWTTLRRTAQNFALFSLSQHNFHSFFLSQGGLLVEFCGVFEGRDPEMCTFGVLGLSCEAPAAIQL